MGVPVLRAIKAASAQHCLCAELAWLQNTPRHIVLSCS